VAESIVRKMPLFSGNPGFGATTLNSKSALSFFCGVHSDAFYEQNPTNYRDRLLPAACLLLPLGSVALGSRTGSHSRWLRMALDWAIKSPLLCLSHNARFAYHCVTFSCNDCHLWCSLPHPWYVQVVRKSELGHCPKDKVLSAH